MTKAPQAASNFLLVCSLCPNRRPFSDVSHCLTHLNSKGHLQSKHKIELQAPADPAAQRRLDAYNLWYATNNIANLLTERMKSAKGAKKLGKKSKSGNSNEDIKSEESAEGGNALKGFHQSVAGQNEPQLAGGEPEHDAGGERNMYGTPKTTRQVPGFTQIDPRNPSTDLAGDDLVGGKGKGGGALELKGERFDGMSVFDAATPNTKRARNQRKGPEVLQQMMKNAAEVEPEETSYHASGDFRATRNIYGPLSTESSPVQKLPTPKRRRSGRPVLHQKDSNRHVGNAEPRNADALLASMNNYSSPYKNFRIPNTLAMALQPVHDDTNYLNLDMISKLDASGPTRNPFMVAAEPDSKIAGMEANAFKKFPDGRTISKLSPVSGYDDGLERMFSGTYQYTSPVFAFARGEDNRRQVAPSSMQNPLSSAYLKSEGQSDSSLEELRFVHPELTLQQTFNHLNEAGVTHGSPTPNPKPIRANGFYDDELCPPYSAQKPRPSYVSPKPLPKIGFFRTSQGGSQSQSGFPSRAGESPSHAPPMTTQFNGMKRDHISSRQGSSTQYGSRPIQSPGYPTTLGPQQHQTPVSKQYSSQATSANSRNFPALHYGDEGEKATPRTSFHPFTRSAARSTAPSPAQSSSQQWEHFSPRTPYGADLEGEYHIGIEDHFSL